jgi:hypothetical protein
VRAAVSALVRFFWDLLYFLTAEGSWNLRANERVVIEAVTDSLPAEAQALLRSQLGGIKFVQRSHKQISRPRFYAAPYLLDRRPVANAEHSEMVVEVQLEVDGVSEVAHVEFYSGRVDSIQFKRPSKYYAGKNLRVMGVRPGRPARTHAAAIDRREHGTKQD